VVVACVVVAKAAKKFVELAYEDEKNVELAFENCCSAVQVLAWPRLRPMVRAVPPLYVPLNVRVPSVAERLARLEPRAMPLIVEFASMALVIAALAMENVPEVPPMRLPRVPEYVRTEPMEGVEVAMLVMVLFPEAYTIWPEERLVEVARPFQEMAGVVPPEETIGQVPETEVTYVPAGCAPMVLYEIVSTPDPLKVEPEIAPVPPLLKVILLRFEPSATPEMVEFCNAVFGILPTETVGV
jgi:hypothetical protein